MPLYMVYACSYGRWGWEQGSGLTLAEAEAQAERLLTLPHVTYAHVREV